MNRQGYKNQEKVKGQWMKRTQIEKEKRQGTEVST